MSTDFQPQKRILARELFDGRLKKFGDREDMEPTEGVRWLTDGRENYLCVWVNDAGCVLEFTKYAWCGDPNHILAAVAEAFETEIFSEHEPQCWGFATWEEMEASTYRRHPQNGEKMS